MTLRTSFRHIPQHRVSRRSLLGGLSALGLASVAMPFVTRPGLAGDELTAFTWSGYDLSELVTHYTEIWGSPPEYSLFGDNDEAFQKINAGYRPDLVAPSSLMVGRFHDAGLIKPIDTSRLSNWADVFDKLKALRGSNTDGEQWYVPQDWGNSSIVFRTDLVDPSYIERNSWTILWDERYAGRLAMNDQMDSAIIPAALVLGVPDPFNMTDDELAEVRKLLEEQKKLLLYYWTSQTDMEQAMASGELVAAYSWNDSVARLKQQGVPVAYMTPVEGILSWVDGYCLVDGGTGDEKAAYDFLDAVISPEAGKAMIEMNSYGAANRKAFDLVDPELLVALGIDKPEDVMDKGVFFDAIEGGLRDKYINLYDEVKAGA
jgi:spermidine/putrescine transport system substrate-binding protein